MLSSHTTNKEVMKQNILYPIGYSIIRILKDYAAINYHVSYIGMIIQYILAMRSYHSPLS